MNHPSEWMRYYDAPRGYFRYRHKGTGVVRDSLMNIGRKFKKSHRQKQEKTRQALKKIVDDETKQMVKKAADKVAEKEADKIQAVLRSGDTPTPKPKPKPAPKVKPQSKTPKVKPKSKPPSVKLTTESRQKLNKMLTPTVGMKLSADSRKKLKQILDLGRAAKLKVNQYISES